MRHRIQVLLSQRSLRDKACFYTKFEPYLLNAKKVGEIVKEEVGQETYTEVLPFFAVCEKCGHLYTTRAYKFDPKTDKVSYKCEGLKSAAN